MSNFYASSFFNDGFRDGYRAISDEAVQPSPPDHVIYANEYLEGFKAGMKEGRADYWADKQEQSFYDWQAGL